MNAEEMHACLHMMEKHRERFERMGILGQRASIPRKLADIPVPVYRLEDRTPEEIERQELRAQYHKDYMKRRRAQERLNVSNKGEK